MVKVMYKGCVPEDYNDSGIAINTFYVTSEGFMVLPDMLTLAKYDCNQCIDMSFISIQSIDYDYTDDIGIWSTVYTGVKKHYDNYFKCELESYTTMPARI